MSCKPLVEASLSSPSQQAASASQTLGMLLEASNEAVLSDTSAGDSNASLHAPLAEPAPDFASRATGSRVVDLATYAINAQKLFPAGSASGTLTISYHGAAAASWPAGTTTLYSGQVSVVVANVLLTNGNGDSLSIPSGSFTYALEAVGTKTDAHNWLITTDATATVANVAATLTHGSKTHTVTLAGNRSVHAELRRIFITNDLGIVTANTRTASLTISGSVAGTRLSQLSPLKDRTFSGWTVTLDGIPITWNRHAALVTQWDYTKLANGTAFSLTTISDATYVSTTMNGTTTTIGPLTATQIAGLLRAKIEAQWL